MPEFIINGIPVNFPFEPYELQKAYMEKVIDCLETGTNGVLESPTGTGKTLSLLCSTLAWILKKKAKVQSQIQKNGTSLEQFKEANTADEILAMLTKESSDGNGAKWSVPKIIYASRTHSQLTQAMQELKQTSYSFMRSVVLGSRDQLCIHPEVMKEINNSSKIQMCKLRILSKSCSFHSRVETKKEHPDFKGPPIMDIEDLIKVGQKLKMCPYYASKELISEADITFMPYNYLLDPKARKANKVELNNTIIILDEAHNVEKLCEDSASVNIKSSDIAMAIDDVTHIMKAISEETIIDSGDEAKDFTIDDLALLKEMLMELEKAVDEIVVDNIADGNTFTAGLIFELLAKANITSNTKLKTLNLLDKLIQFLANQTQNSALRKGNSFSTLSDLLTIVFSSKEDDMAKVLKCFKVHVQIEETKQQKTSTRKDNWITPRNATTTKLAKIIHYWCFNPGFGMEQLLNKNIRSIILTSGTLAPLKPLIAELGIPIKNRLENPHIVTKSQVCVKIVSFGPDKEPLISNYQNRDNPKYINSLGRTIQTLCPVIPDGLLIFFPSYPLMNKCVDSWQSSGIWSNICRYKPVYVEPRSKDAFTTTMTEFYEAINDPKTKGACFMAVCRGKVSEGLDFADINGRAVIITGLPFPPLKDPRVVLKRKYLEENRTKENELLSGQNWYALEATRAVNQAIGRVIRHRNDYGAILLCDSRFNYPSQISQLSSWVQEHLKSSKQYQSFGPIIADLSKFFKNADKSIIKPNLRKCETLTESKTSMAECKPSNSFDNPDEILEAKHKFKMAVDTALKIEKSNNISSWSPEDYTTAAGKINASAPSAKDFLSRLEGNVSTLTFNNIKNEEKSESPDLVKIHKRERLSPNNTSQTETDSIKKKRFKLVNNSHFTSQPTSSSSSSQLSQFSLSPIHVSSLKDEKSVPSERAEFLKLIKNSITDTNYNKFVKSLFSYQKDDNFELHFKTLSEVFGEPCLHYLLKAMRRFVKDNHKSKFDTLLLHFR